MSEKFLHVCAACGEIHACGKCPMEEFYNLIRKWYVPSKHVEMFPAKVEEMFNRTLASFESGTSRAFYALHLCIC